MGILETGITLQVTSTYFRIETLQCESAGADVSQVALNDDGIIIQFAPNTMQPSCATVIDGMILDVAQQVQQLLPCQENDLQHSKKDYTESYHTNY